jgi:hypothetical protein
MGALGTKVCELPSVSQTRSGQYAEAVSRDCSLLSLVIPRLVEPGWHWGLTRLWKTVRFSMAIYYVACV